MVLQGAPEVQESDLHPHDAVNIVLRLDLGRELVRVHKPTPKCPHAPVVGPAPRPDGDWRRIEDDADQWPKANGDCTVVAPTEEQLQ